MGVSNSFRYNAAAAVRSTTMSCLHLPSQCMLVQLAGLHLIQLMLNRVAHTWLVSVALALHSSANMYGLLIASTMSRSPAALAATWEGVIPCYAMPERCCVSGMQANYLGHWLLTHQLLAGQQHLRKSQGSLWPMQQTQQPQNSSLNGQHHNNVPGHVAGSRQHGSGCGKRQGTRVVMLTPMMHSAGRIRFDDLHAKKNCNGFPPTPSWPHSWLCASLQSAWTGK